jgi:hypothetical protein
MIKDSFDDDFEYSVECDGCGKQMKNPDDEKSTFVAHFYDVTSIVKSKGWTVDGDHCYCPKCTKAKDEYSRDDNTPYMFMNYSDNNEDYNKCKELFNKGYDFLKSKGFKGLELDDLSLSVPDVAVPDLIQFYKNKGFTVKQDDSFFELNL